MTIREAELDAEAMLDTFWWSEPHHPLPVDPFDIAQSLGIDVQKAWMSADQSGQIVIPPSGDVRISVNAFDHNNRQRFTVAHEIGHYQRRSRDVRSATTTFIDNRNTLAGLGRDVEEIYANQFAAALLMPASVVKERFANGWSSLELARLLQTSVQALELRLRNLGLT